MNSLLLQATAAPASFMNGGWRAFSCQNWPYEAIFEMLVRKNWGFNAKSKRLIILDLIALTKTDRSDPHHN